jgi:hypothetical protein
MGAEFIWQADCQLPKTTLHYPALYSTML